METKIYMTSALLADEDTRGRYLSCYKVRFIESIASLCFQGRFDDKLEKGSFKKMFFVTF